MSAADLSLRPATPEDGPFLFRVYAGTRQEELAPTGWSDEQKEGFLRMQFAAQDAHYRAHYPGAEYLVIELAGEAVGRLYLWRSEKETRVMDIALLPHARGRGLGSRLLREVIAQAQAAGRDVSIHVEEHNPARRLYQRLGFREVELRGIYLYMVRPAHA